MTLHFKQRLMTFLIAVMAINCLAANGERETINDLRYGESLYHFYQQQYFSAITDLMVAKQRNPITAQDASPELLLGSLYLYYGLHHEASNIFTGLIENNTSKETQDRAWFNIGKMQYQGKLLAEAQKTLNKISEPLSPEREAERQDMLANTYLKQLDFDPAYKVLQKLGKHKDWQAYARFNMGIALIKTGNTAAGTGFLAKVGQLETDDEELKALKDKANIALGYAHIRNKEPEISTKYLEKVRLKGPLSAKALLGIGWAYQQQNKPEQALVPWLELRNWPVIDTAVQESLLAVPYTLEQMGKNKLALEHYQYAIKNFNTELRNVNNVIHAVKTGELLFALKPAMIREDALAPEYINKLPKSISSPYIHYLLNSVDFQHTHKNYLDLVYLRKNLSDWNKQFPAYSLMLKERRNFYEKQKKSLLNDSRLTLLNTLKIKRDKLSRKIQEIKNKHDVLALATEDEAEALDSLGKAKRLLDRLKNKTDVSEQRSKYNLIHGLILWDISTDYAPRLWKVQNELNQLNVAITAGDKNLLAINKSAQNAPGRFSGFKNIILNKKEKLNKILKKINLLIHEQESLIEKQALTSLQQRYRQIENYNIRASYSLARLHDRMTLSSKINEGNNK